jgi:hypothetical protein
MCLNGFKNNLINEMIVLCYNLKTAELYVGSACTKDINRVIPTGQKLSNKNKYLGLDTKTDRLTD